MKTGQWESFIHHVVTWYYNNFESRIQLTFTLQSADWFISWLCFCCLALASLPSKPFHYSLIELRILQRQASHRLLLCWQFNLKVCLILPSAMNRSLTDAIFSGDFGIIFNSFCFNNNLSLNVRLYDVQRALVMTTTWLEVNDCKHEIVWYTLRMRILLSLPLKGQLNLC